jgi:hypothetical protein
MEKIDFTKDFLDYDWLKKRNVEVRCQNNRTIMNRYLKIEKPDFETLRRWIMEQHNDKSNKKNNNLSKTTKTIVEFNSKKLKKSIKISLFNLIWKLSSELSSKTSFKDYNNLSLLGGLSEITNDLSWAIGGREILDDVDPLSVRVMFLLNQYILKYNIDLITKKYALIRGLMQDVLLVQSNLIKLRASLNTFHIMSILGFDYLFDIDSLCLYLEMLINTIVTGIRSYIEKLWRVVHNFSNERDIKNKIAKEIPNCYDKKWITSLEEVYSIITVLHRKHNINPPSIKNQSLNPGLYFNLYNDATTLFIVNDLRNAHIHRDSPVSGANKDDLNIQINENEIVLTRYSLYYSIPFIKKGSIIGGFKDYLTNEDINLSNVDDLDILYYRTKWRTPPELNEILGLFQMPTLFTPDLPERSHIELKWKIPGNNETMEYQEYKQKVLNVYSTAIKDMNITGFRQISIFNLSDCIWSLFDSLKRLLKSFLIKKLYNKEL